MPSYDNYQPSLALTESIVTSGVFEGPGSGSGAGVAFMRIFAGNFGMDNQPLASGQLMAISQNTALFSLIGTYYGGDGKSTFALPDLGGRLAVGTGHGPGLNDVDIGETFGNSTIDVGQPNLTFHSGGSSQPLDNEQPSLGMHYMIQVSGVFPSQDGNGTGAGNWLLGDVALFAGNFSPEGGWMDCNGQLLSIAENEALFALIGTTYGGDGVNTFALPDLRGRTIVGTGTGPGLAQVYLGQEFGTETTTIQQSQMPTGMGGSGQPLNNQQPSLALNYVIALQGIYPSRDGGGYEDNEAVFLGEILSTAVSFAPGGFALCAGQLLPIAQNTALFSLLGTYYGGDGRTTFALPDLRGRSVIGTDATHDLGGQYGSSIFDLTANFSSLTINDDDNGHSLYGGNANDLIMGNGGDDYIDGGLGADTAYGGQGNDTFIVDNAADLVFENAGEGTSDTVYASVGYILSAEVENLTLTGGADINGTGNNGNNTLTGNGGKNVLKGLGGNDWLDGGGATTNTLYGGAGDDTYIVSTTHDQVREDTVSGVDDGGIDTVRSAIAYTLGAFVENLALTGAGNINGTGNGLNNTLTGNDGTNILTGLGGNDWLDGAGGINNLYGGAGDDTYVVASTHDHVHEDTVAGVDDGGIDTVRSAIDYTLDDFVENLTLTGLGNINATGNGLGNVIKGNAGNNVINGGNGADTMSGGAGDDTYVVGTGADVVIENVNEGTDTVNASTNYTLGANVENLTLIGSGNINGTGNGLGNLINGNSGNNVLDGQAGVDTMSGGVGDDTYVVNVAGDVVIENINEGTDLVLSSASYTLADNVENLTLTGSGNINATGNGLGNLIAGNSGNNLISGGNGADTMSGGQGDDTYVVGQGGDTIIENVNEGNDTVNSTATYTLGANLENMVLLSNTNINATGNELNNSLTGNSGNNRLSGLSGNDTLTGGAGADTFVFGQAGATNGVDHVTDFQSGTDRLAFAASSYFAAGHVLAAGELSLTGAAVGSNAQFVYDSGSHTLYWDADGAGAGAMIAVVVLNGAPATGDFMFA